MSRVKRNAVLLSLENGRSVKNIADNLGIHKDLINHRRKKREQLGEIAFPGIGVQALTPEQRRIKKLKKKLKDAEMERDIIQKAMTIFSRTQ